MPAPPAKVSLTGIKPTGEPHLGNYVGAIKPALKLAQEYEAMYFIADYHALTTLRGPELLRHYTRSVAAAWIAAGLDPDRVTFYRQSDIPEIFEFTWTLACMTPKGLMNRAHAYKAARDRNLEAGKTDADAGINLGLYNYPVLMAVDILIMQTDVGTSRARPIAARGNSGRHRRFLQPRLRSELPAEDSAGGHSPCRDRTQPPRCRRPEDEQVLRQHGSVVLR